jgi:integrase
VALSRPQWLADLSRSFKRHRQGRPGWSIEEHRDRLRLVSSELPPRPDEPPGTSPKRRAVTLTAPPGPGTALAALTEACSLFDAVMAGAWRWPDADDVPAADDRNRLSPAALQRLVDRLEKALVGEQIASDTWERTYAPYLGRLVAMAGKGAWSEDRDLLVAALQQWRPGTRSRQMAFERFRRLWKEAGWPWPSDLQPMRGGGKAAADPAGVRSFSDEEIAELRARIMRSRLTPGDLLAWDLLVVFGLRPAEVKGVQLAQKGPGIAAVVSRIKQCGRGSTGARTVAAVPPAGWPADCYDLLNRWKQHGLPAGMVAARSPGQVLNQQLIRLRRQAPISVEIDSELTPYGMRHAFALRLGVELQLSAREAAVLMGHSPAVHLNAYGRRLESPKLLAKVAELAANR